MATIARPPAAAVKLLALVPKVLSISKLLGALYALLSVGLGFAAAVLWAVGAPRADVALCLGFAGLLTLWAKRV
jgi:hypothetical protein